MVLIFLDTEFSDLSADAELISLGLVAEDGARIFYAELADRSVDAGDFARDHILPLLEGGAALMTMPELAARLAAWLSGLGPAQIVTDSVAWDWPWLEQILGDTWPADLERRPISISGNDLIDDYWRDETFDRAVAEAFAGGLCRHHALDDAKALRQGWLAAKAVRRQGENS